MNHCGCELAIHCGFELAIHCGFELVIHCGYEQVSHCGFVKLEIHFCYELVTHYDYGQVIYCDFVLAKHYDYDSYCQLGKHCGSCSLGVNQHDCHEVIHSYFWLVNHFGCQVKHFDFLLEMHCYFGHQKVMHSSYGYDCQLENRFYYDFYF